MPSAWPILVLRWLRTPGLSAVSEKASVILDEAEALLDPVSDIEGFMLACLVDASTGMVLASRKDQGDISLPTAGCFVLAEPAQSIQDPAEQFGLSGSEGVAGRHVGRPDRRAHHGPVLPGLRHPVRQAAPGRRQHRGRREDLRPEPPVQRPGWFGAPSPRGRRPWPAARRGLHASRHRHGPADQWMAKSARVYPSALTVGWMKLFSIIRAACASAALISGPVTFGFCLTCVNARFCAWP